jgi:HK97 family phage major capsid protein
MKKTLKELREALASKVAEMRALVEVSEAENRSLNETEQASFDTLDSEINDHKSRIERLERALELSAAPIDFKMQDPKEDKTLRQFSFGALAKAAYTGRLEGIVKEMDEEARLEAPQQLFRGVAVPAKVLQMRNAVGEKAGVENASFVDQLEANSVLVQAGANFYSGLQADRQFPIVSSITASFIGENLDGTSDVSESGSLSTKSLTPKKIISVVGMSAELLAQNAGVEKVLQRNMAQAVMAQFEKNLLADADAATGPTSIFLDAASYADTTTNLTIADLLGMETTILGNNINPAAARLAYLFNPTALGAAKGLAGAEYVAGFMDNFQKTLNTYKYHVSNNVGNVTTGTVDQILFGDFSDVHLGQFGGMSVLFDPYTNASKGLGRLVVTNLVDGLAARPAQTLVRFTDTNS